MLELHRASNANIGGVPQLNPQVALDLLTSFSWEVIGLWTMDARPLFGIRMLVKVRLTNHFVFLPPVSCASMHDCPLAESAVLVASVLLACSFIAFSAFAAC